jgi:putative drug exporter of the RND superfamily
VVDRFVELVGRLRWPVAAAWLVALVVAAVVGAPLPTLLSGGGWAVKGSDSAIVEQQLQDGFVGRGASNVTVIVHDRWYDAGQPGFEKRVTDALNKVRRNDTLDVRSSVGYSTVTGDARAQFLGDDGRTAVDVLGLSLDDGTARRVLPGVQSGLTRAFGSEGLDVSLVGTSSFWGEVNHMSEQGLLRAEMFTLPLIVVVLVLLFGGVVAALASLAVAVTSILFTFGVLTLLAHDYELSVFVQNTATMLGLGVGVDYSLFLIARFKEELAKGRDVDSALATTLRTSGETVLFSGVTVVAAMSTLFLVPLAVISSIALGAVVVVAFTVLCSVLLLPVLLRLLGHRISRGTVLPARGAHRRPASARWVAFAGRVMRRPVLFLTVGLAVLLTLAWPATGLRTFTPDAQIVPQSSPVRSGFDRMQSQFGVGSTAPVQIVVASDRPLTQTADSASVEALAADLAALPGASRVDSALPVLAQASPTAPLAALDPGVRSQLPPDAQQLVGHYVSDDARKLVLEVVPDATASSPQTQDLLTAARRLTNDVPVDGATVTVGGETAQGVESNDVISDRLPSVVGVMLVVIYLLLLVTFRSVFLPLKAIAMNLLSVAATFGVLVLVFQHGFGVRLLGVDGAGDIQNFVPVLLLTLLFSLSTDYEVFLLNRVREDFQQTGDNTGSVARGLAHTAPLISGAATLMVVVFGAFALAGIMPIKQLGFGMAVAIALDATIVRLIVVPASMRLMGRWNWWMPGRGLRVSPAAAVPQPGESAEPPAPRRAGVAAVRPPAAAVRAARRIVRSRAH